MARKKNVAADVADDDRDDGSDVSVEIAAQKSAAAAVAPAAPAPVAERPLSEREKSTLARLASRDTEYHPSVHELNVAYNRNRKAEMETDHAKHAAITAVINKEFGVNPGAVVSAASTGTPVASGYA